MTLSVVDDRGRAIALPAPPERIVSLVPSDSYTLARLGAGPRLVGRTRFCVEPATELAGATVVGGVRDPDLDAIRLLAPDLVVASIEDNRRSDVAALESAGVPVLVGHPRTVAEGLAHARRLATLLGPAAAARRATLERASEWLDRAERLRSGVRLQRLVVVVWPEPLIVLGPQTHGASVARLAGAALATLEHGGDYPRIDDVQLRALGPDALLLPDEPYDFSPEEGERLGVRAAAPGAQPPRIVHCDGRTLFWYGLRAIDGVDRLRAALG